MNLLRKLLARYLNPPTGPLVFALGLGIAIRCSITITLQAPLNDGGFWYAFSRAIEHAGFALPPTISFNGTEVPTTYPPLAAYLLATLERYTSLDLFLLMQWLPLLLSVVALVLFARFALVLLGVGTAAYASVFAFALSPTSFQWFLMGGGVSRGLGLVFMLTSWLVLCPNSNSTRRMILGSGAGALAILSHPVAGLITLCGHVLLLGFHRRRWKTAVLCASLSLALVSPWLLLSTFHHGITPYLLAARSRNGGWLERLILLPNSFGSITPLAVFAMAGLCGGWNKASTRFGAELFIVMWIVCFRAMPSDFGCVSLALLAGCGTEMILGFFRQTSRQQLASQAFIILVALTSIIDSTITAWKISTQTIPAAEFARIKTLATEPGEHQKIVVVSQQLIAGEAIGEWIAALTPHQIPLLHQVAEWSGTFSERLAKESQIDWCCINPVPTCLTTIREILREAESNLIFVHSRSCAGLGLLLTSSGACRHYEGTTNDLLLCPSLLDRKV